MKQGLRLPVTSIDANTINIMLISGWWYPSSRRWSFSGISCITLHWSSFLYIWSIVSILRDVWSFPTALHGLVCNYHHSPTHISCVTSVQGLSWFQTIPFRSMLVSYHLWLSYMMFSNETIYISRILASIYRSTCLPERGWGPMSKL